MDTFKYNISKQQRWCPIEYSDKCCNSHMSIIYNSRPYHGMVQGIQIEGIG